MNTTTPMTFDALLDLIGEFGREVYYLLDDCETSGPVGEETHTITPEGLQKVSDLLDRIDALPFEEPGCILGTGAMLQTALSQTANTLVAAAYRDAARAEMTQLVDSETNPTGKIIACTPDEIAWRILIRTPVNAIDALRQIESDAEARGYQRAMAEWSAIPSPSAQAADGVAAIAAERQRQIEAEGWTPEHDDAHQGAELAQAAAAYALNCCDDSDSPALRFLGADIWPWATEWWKPSGDPRRDLAKSGALIAAEIDRINRAAARAVGSGGASRG